MKRVIDDEKLILRVCELYYNQSMGQGDVAKELGLSRPTVSKMLIKAREEGIVRIIIADLAGRNHLDTEQQLEKKYGLKSAIVTDSHEDRTRQNEELGKATANFMCKKLQDNFLVGVSMGSTLYRIAHNVPEGYVFHGLRFIPMIGGVGKMSMELHSNNIAQALATSFRGEALLMHAPAMVTRIQTKKELLQEESISSALALAEKVDMAISGIGAPVIDSSIIKTGYLSSEMIEDFAKHNICGDICLNFYDADGNISNYEHNQRVMGVEVETLRKVPWSLGVAGGTLKVGAIRGALAGGYINVLITDFECAKQLLEQE